MDLFTRLYALAGDRDEDFTTESLRIVLDRLLAADPASGLSLAQYLSANVIDPSETDASSVRTTTRAREGSDVPDLAIFTGKTLTYVEAKVEAGLGPTQLKRYREKLLRSDRQKTSLVTLTRYRLGQVDTEPDARLTWLDLGEWLDALLGASVLSEPSKYLVKEYLDFLRGRGLAQCPPRSAMSRTLVDYSTNHPEDSVFMGKPVRSLAKLEAIGELQPLTKFLKVLEEALGRHFPKKQLRLSSGVSGRQGPWIGYNIQAMSYFLCIYLYSPDRLVFETYDAKVDPDIASELGEPTYRNNKKWCWSTSVDLAASDNDFYSKSASDQVAMISDFVGGALAIARKLAA
jgi:hypothetical protein